MSSDKAEVLRTLRQIQADRLRSLGINHHISSDTQAHALEQATRRETDSRREDDLIYRGPFKYPANLEQLRWQHTREIIERVIPGPDEDANFLEMLARQAASVEMLLRNEDRGSPTEPPNNRMTELLQRVLLATTPEPLFDAESLRVNSNYILVWLSAGLIEFTYQMAKAVVLAWKQETPEAGWTLKHSTKLADIKARLAEDPYPIDLLLGTLTNYLFKGWPRHEESKLPPIEYHPPLLILTSMSERFAIAHEYSHAFLHHSTDFRDFLPKEFQSLSEKAAWTAEFQADLVGYHITLGSARQFDLLPNNIALQGPLFVLHAYDILQQALDIMRSGTVQEDQGSESHPPMKSRIKFLKDQYLNEPHDEGDPAQAIKGALAPVETLDLLWKNALPRFIDLRGTAELCPIWGRPSMMPKSAVVQHQSNMWQKLGAQLKTLRQLIRK